MFSCLDQEGKNFSVTEEEESDIYRKLENRCRSEPTFRGPDEPDGQEVLQVVDQNVFDLEVLFDLDGAGAAGGHDEPWPVQTDAGQPGGEAGRRGLQVRYQAWFWS